MTTFPSLAVLLTVYNQRSFLEEAITSILSQSYREFEFVIVDDGSTDGSCEVIKAAARQDSRIRLVPLAKNLGLAGALQAGLAVISTDLVARMDGDDVALPQRLERQLDVIERHGLDVLGTGYSRLGGSCIWPTGTLRLPLQTHDRIVRNLPYANEFCHPSVMFRRKVIDLAGGYDTRFVLAQDYDLWLRLIGQARFGNMPQPLLQMRRHASRSSGPQNRLRHTQFSVTAATNHFLRLAGRLPLDPAGPTAGLAAALVGLLLLPGQDPSAQRAMVRHAMRLARYCDLPSDIGQELKAAVMQCADWKARGKWRLYGLG